MSQQSWNLDKKKLRRRNPLQEKDSQSLDDELLKIDFTIPAVAAAAAAAASAAAPGYYFYGLKRIEFGGK